MKGLLETVALPFILWETAGHMKLEFSQSLCIKPTFFTF